MIVMNKDIYIFCWVNFFFEKYGFCDYIQISIKSICLLLQC